MLLLELCLQNKDRVEGGIIFCLGVPGENFIDKKMLKVGT